MANSPYDASVNRRKKSIVRAPRISKGVYNVVGTVTNAKSFGGAMLSMSMKKEFFGEGEMCGSCKLTAIAKYHDPNKHKRWKCQLCGTDWFGIEPGNDRRGAIMAQRRRKQDV